MDERSAGIVERLGEHLGKWLWERLCFGESLMESFEECLGEGLEECLGEHFITFPLP